MAIELGLSGLASGFDWRALVDQLVDIERAPQLRLRAEQSGLTLRNNAFTSIVSALNALKTRVDALKEEDLFNTRMTAVGDSSVAGASATSNAALGTYSFQFLQLAAASSREGTSNVGSPLSATNDVSALVLSNAAFATSVTAGTFTVNGSHVAIATSDTLQQVLDKISTATGGAVTGSYNTATDKITLSSASPIVLGSGTDTSNFLQAAKLGNNGTGTVSSSGALGVVRLTIAMASANFSTAISDGGSGAGEFKINGVSISFNASTDTVNDVIGRINNSAAGVTASYDSVNDRFVLTNKSAGDIGMALQDVTGNFLAASGLSAGTLQRGKDLQYTVNGGATMTSHSNTITETEHGIAGLTVNALQGPSSTSTAPNQIGVPMLIERFGGAGTQTQIRTAPDHGWQTGYAVRFQSTGTLPSQIQAGVTYYVRRIDVDDISLHTSAADAVSGANAINFGTSPSFTGDAYAIQIDPLTGGTSTGSAPTTTVTISSDTGKIKTAITDFIAEYNKVQSLIGTQTSSTTDSKGVVTAGVLAAENEASEVSSQLRALANATLAGLTGTIKRLASLGIDSNGNDDTIALTDAAVLDSALAANLSEVQKLFTDSTEGLAVKLSAYLEKTAGEEGSLTTRQTTLNKQVAGIDTQIADLERIVQSNRSRLIDSFVAMERAQANINQQLQYLAQRFG